MVYRFEYLVNCWLNSDGGTDLQKLGLWQPLSSLLDSTASSTEIKIQVLWVIGTALQNNPAAQDVVRYFSTETIRY